MEYFSRFLITTPLILYYPWSIRLSDISRPAKKFKKVVLPEPDGPKIAVKDSAGIIPFCVCRIVLLGCFLIFASIFIWYEIYIGFLSAKIDDERWPSCNLYLRFPSVYIWSENFNKMISMILSVFRFGDYIFLVWDQVMSYFIRVDIVPIFLFDSFKYNEGLLKISRKI